MKLKRSFKSAGVTIATMAIMLACWVLAGKYPLIYVVFIAMYFLMIGISALKTRQRIHAAAAKRGLTPQDLKNIRFTKSWTDIRQQGIWRYLVIEGAIFSGNILALTLGVATFLLLKLGNTNPADSPSLMFSLVGYSYLVGLLCGIIFRRVIWSINERRYKYLTDPFLVLTKNAG